MRNDLTEFELNWLSTSNEWRRCSASGPSEALARARVCGTRVFPDPGVESWPRTIAGEGQLTAICC